MREDVYDEGRLRKYLLGELNEAEQQGLEERLLRCDELLDLLLLAEDELIDDYVGGALSTDERSRFDSFFLSTPDRRRKLSFAMALRRYVVTETAVAEPAIREAAPAIVAEGSPVAGRRSVWWKQPFASPYLRMAAAAVIVLGVGLGTWRAFFYQSEVAKGLAALARAYSAERPVEARISGLGYAPLPNTRGSGHGRVDEISLNRAQRILLDEVAEHPSSAAHQAVGRLYLTEQKFDKAIEQFETALKFGEKNAQLHSDYAAALLEMGRAYQSRGESGKSFEQFAQGNEHLNKALELDGSLLEALFNRALCHEYLLLYREAEKDWKDYLEKDPNSKWANEARQRLKEIEERHQQSSQNRERLFQDFLDAYRAKDDGRAWKIISQSRDSTGGFIESRLIDDHLALAVKGHDDEAKEKLDALSYAGELEYQQVRDLFLSDLARFYTSATPTQRANIFQARSLVSSGHENYSKNNFDAALESYNRAKDTFERAGDACEATYLSCLIGNCYVQQSKAELGLSLLQPLAQTYQKKLYKWLLARTLNAVCTANQYLRDFSMAISNGNRSLILSEEIGDTIGAIRTRYLLAAAYRFVNDCQKALDLYVKDLPLARTHTPQPAQVWRYYASISLTFDQLNLYGAAVDFQKEALQLAIEAEAPRFICRSYNFLGFIIAEHGDYVEAADNIKRAIEIGNTLEEKGVRVEALAYSFLQLGYVYRKLGDFDEAIENYDQAIQSYGELDSKFFNYMARKEKLLCCMEHGGCPSFEQEMVTVLNLFEQHRTKILEESLRNTFFDAEQTIYDVAIEFEHFKEGDSKKAFDYSERSRGRSLRDLISKGLQIVEDPNNPDVRPGEVSQPMTIEEIQARLPEQARILQYAVLKNNILIWVVTKDGHTIASQSISIGDLNRRVNNFRELVSDASGKDHEEFSREAMYLYDLLIKPVEYLLVTEELCIVPDKILNYLPFAALISQASGRYFVQDHRFVLSPSSNIFILCSDSAREKESTKSERLLSVGNPLFDSKTFPDLANLRSAAEEAKAITDYYESPGPIIGASATKRRVMSEMEESDVIHLATHAVADEWYPLRSKILLAKDASGAWGKDSDGVLEAYEIYKLNLARAKLVVLSACQTGVEKYYGGEGMIGLSRPFIAKRIPLVVASLWPVASDATARLMINFHRIRKTGGQPTAEALRQAQVEMIEDAESDNRLPYTWASFVAIGGYASF